MGSLRISSFLLLLLATHVSAQTAGPTALDTSPSIANATAEEIEKSFGKPDRRTPSESGESWYYGNSVIFFSAGKVSAWTDGGDLEDHRLAAQVAVTSSSEGSQPRGWVNAWTREKQVTTEEVIDDLLEEQTPPGEASSSSADDVMQ